LLNFWAVRGHWQNVEEFGAGRYFSDEQDGLQAHVPINDDGEAVLVNVKDEGRFYARNADSLDPIPRGITAISVGTQS
jgi:hypothetical protein